MKNIFLIVGFILIIINTLAGFIFQDYDTYKMLFADFSILLTTGIFYVTYSLPIPAGFQIGYTLLFAITGIVRFICAILSGQEIQNNISLLFFVILFCVECLFVFVGYIMRNK